MPFRRRRFVKPAHFTSGVTIVTMCTPADRGVYGLGLMQLDLGRLCSRGLLLIDGV